MGIFFTVGGRMRGKYQFSSEIKEQLLNLQKMDNMHGIIAVLYDYLIIALAISLTYISVWFYPITLILIGSRQRAFATILHEAAHHCLAKSKKLERFMATFMTGYLIFQEFDKYKDSHVKKHHAYLGDEGLDPDYDYHLNLKLYDNMSSLKFFCKNILGALFLLKTPSYFYYLLVNRLKPSLQYWKNSLSMLLYWAAIILIFSHYNLLLPLLIFWLIPLLTSSMVIGWFNELSEHYPLPSEHYMDLYMSRNRFSHGIEHFLFNTHNENYHLTHHLRSRIPFWNLPRAHKIMCRNENYNAINNDFGGIFISANMVTLLLRNSTVNGIITE